MTVTTARGKFTRQVDEALGSRLVPFDDDGLKGKFLELRDWLKENLTPESRPLKIVDGGKPWREVSRECLDHFQQAALHKLWKTADARTMSSETLALFGG